MYTETINGMNPAAAGLGGGVPGVQMPQLLTGNPAVGRLGQMQQPGGFNTEAAVAMLNQQNQLLMVMITMLMRLMINQQQGGANSQQMGGTDALGGSSASGGANGASGSSSSSGTNTNGGSSSSSSASPGTQALLQRAGGMVGMTETGNTAEIQKITGKSGINPATTPWCAAFAINLMKEHGTLDTEGLSNPNYCPTIKAWAKEKGKYLAKGQTPKAGDAILFDWQGDGTTDHIGIVEKVENGKITTIEGNSSNSVKRNSYSINDPKIDGFVISK